MAVQTSHRFTAQDYHRMAQTGVLRPDARVELLNGQIIDMSPIGSFHGGVVNRLNRSFTARSRGRWLVSTQNPIRLDDYSEPEPDLMLLRPEPDDYTNRHPGPGDVSLLIEVADTTLALDRGEKLSAQSRCTASPTSPATDPAGFCAPATLRSPRDSRTRRSTSQSG